MSGLMSSYPRPPGLKRKADEITGNDERDPARRGIKRARITRHLEDGTWMSQLMRFWNARDRILASVPAQQAVIFAELEAAGAGNESSKDFEARVAAKPGPYTHRRTLNDYSDALFTVNLIRANPVRAGLDRMAQRIEAWIRHDEAQFAKSLADRSVDWHARMAAKEKRSRARVGSASGRPSTRATSSAVPEPAARPSMIVKLKVRVPTSADPSASAATEPAPSPAPRRRGFFEVFDV